MLRKILIITGIILAGIIVFYVTIILTLPTESFIHYAEKTIEKQLSQKQKVEIESLSVSPFLNVTMKKFEMTPRSAGDESLRTEEGEDKEINGYICASSIAPMTFTIDEASVNPSLFKLMKKEPSGSFSMKFAGGSFDGTLTSKGNAREIIFKASEISLNDFILLSNLSGMQIYGDLGIDGRVVLDNSKIADLSIKMLAADTVLCPKRLKLNIPSLPYFDLPFTVFGDISAEMSISDDKLVIEKMSSSGPDIALDTSGSVTLKSNKNAVPRLNLNIKVSPSEDWLEKNKMKSIYQICERLDDGSIQIKLTGTTKKPKMDCGTPIPETVDETDEPKEIKTAPDTEKSKSETAPPPEAPPEDQKPNEDEKKKTKVNEGPNAGDNRVMIAPRIERNDLRDTAERQRAVRPQRIHVDGEADIRLQRDLDIIDKQIESDSERIGRGRERRPERGIAVQPSSNIQQNFNNRPNRKNRVNRGAQTDE